MLTENEIEAVAIDSAAAYKASTDIDGFMEIMKDKHYNVPPYIFLNHFYAIDAYDQ